MHRYRVLPLLGVGLLALGLNGCGMHQASGTGTGATAPVTAAKQGKVTGGEQPVRGAAIQLYAVGTTGGGSPATPLLTSSVVTDASGGFTLTGLYSCPSATAPVYLTATGGDPGLGQTIPALALMSALGSCGNLTSSS